MTFTVIIPARYQSVRFPAKMLARFQGKTMLEYSYRKACLSAASRVLIATDHQLIFDEAKAFGAEVVMTSVHHASGTDRAAEVVSLGHVRDTDVLVNLQADEPLMPAAVINQLAGAMLQDNSLQVATLATTITESKELGDPNVVKVVTDYKGMALYFSRAPVPWDRHAWQTGVCALPDAALAMYQRHIGLYAYRASFLQRYTSWSSAPIETIECLEQLRILWHGERIRVLQACEMVPSGVDTVEDWERVQPAIAGS
jgi:3-deoxy-manno-octulosonate cytidylyltransferase (CMP-KDO synthetase)